MKSFNYKITAVGQNRTVDTRIFSPLLYRLSYNGKNNGILISVFIICVKYLFYNLLIIWKKRTFPLSWLVHPCTGQAMSLRIANSLLRGTSGIPAAVFLAARL